MTALNEALTPMPPQSHADSFMPFDLGLTLQSARSRVFDDATGVTFEQAFGVGPVDVTPSELLRRRAEWARHQPRDQRIPVSQFERSLSLWQDRLRQEAQSVHCSAADAGLDPPLGWTLGVADRRLLRCLAFREALLLGPYD